jgi:cysteinyl-tRNA synthetase
MAKSSLNTGDIEKAGAILNQIKNTYSLLGLFEENAKSFVEKYGETGEEIPAEVKAVAEERWTARLEKNWAKSDELREKLSALGYLVKDSKEGYTLEKK